MYPTIRVGGGARERGRQYGEAARERVLRSVAAYREVFAQQAGWEWDRVRAEAAAFAAPIERHGAKYLEEIRGIAEGAGLDELDVLAINVRTEVMFAAKARQAAAGVAPPAPSLPLECSALAVLPERTVDGRLLVAQNWDWLVHSFETVVVLEAEQDDGPDFVTVVEAGLLAKTGMNSAGIAVATNALVTTDDLGRPGLPYHVLLRSLLDAETVSDGLAAILRSERSSSANYLLGDEDGVVLHVNHFTGDGRDVRDVSLWAMPDSPFRLARLKQLTAPEAGPLGVEACQRILCDERMRPYAICCRPDPRDEGIARWATIAGVVMDPRERTLWLASGIPADSGFERVDYGAFLSKRSRLR